MLALAIFDYRKTQSQCQTWTQSRRPICRAVVRRRFAGACPGPLSAGPLRPGGTIGTIFPATHVAAGAQTIVAYSVDLTAAGGVVLRRRVGAPPEVVVCGRPAVSVWALPKGKPNEGEPPEATARREVQEETGLEVDVGPFVGEVTYSFYRPNDGALCNKVVRFFLMSPTGGDLARHDGDFDQVLWLPASDAKALLTYENEARILEQALAMATDPSA